jgi:hypothetical protein
MALYFVVVPLSLLFCISLLSLPLREIITIRPFSHPFSALNLYNMSLPSLSLCYTCTTCPYTPWFSVTLVQHVSTLLVSPLHLYNLFIISNNLRYTCTTRLYSPCHSVTLVQPVLNLQESPMPCVWRKHSSLLSPRKHTILQWSLLFK